MHIGAGREKDKINRVLKRLGFIKIKEDNWIKINKNSISRLHAILKQYKKTKNYYISLHRDIGVMMFKEIHRTKYSDNGLIRMKKKIENGLKNEFR